MDGTECCQKNEHFLLNTMCLMELISQRGSEILMVTLPSLAECVERLMKCWRVAFVLRFRSYWKNPIEDNLKLFIMSQDSWMIAIKQVNLFSHITFFAIEAGFSRYIFSVKNW